MQTKNYIGGAVIALLSVSVAVLAIENYRLSRKLVLGAKCSVPGAKSEPSAQCLVPAAEKTPDAKAEEKREIEQKVVDVVYDGDDDIAVIFSERPDMGIVREYIEAGPVNAGSVAYRYEARYNNRTEEYDPCVHVTGDFAYRTNLTLKVHAGFPVWGKSSTSNLTVVAMKEDFEATLRRKDAPPFVRFATGGRYLAPIGSRAIALETVNVELLHTEIRRVPAANIVEMLALEENEYMRIRKCSWPNEEEWLEDIAGVARVADFPIEAGINETVKNLISVVPADGLSSNGVFLVMARDGKRDRKEHRPWWNDDNKPLNPNRYRLVTVTDLGISARAAKDEIVVWTTSLTSGRPVADATVEIFSCANILLGKGVTGEDGVARCEIAKGEGEPFAVVVTAADDVDRSFIALTDGMSIDESAIKAGRDGFLGAGEVSAFAWTDRGIYRHGEKIFYRALVRDGEGKTPTPFPLELRLQNPEGRVESRSTVFPDADGAILFEEFAIPAERPSGAWYIVLATPGEKGRVLAEREVKIEEFVPPQIRVKVAADESRGPADFAFSVAAEHLYGAAAKGLRSEGAVVYEDAPFAPRGWSGYRFGNERLGLKPNFRRLPAGRLDDAGRAVIAAPLFADKGKPRAAVRVTCEGTVFEDGGRPAVGRVSRVLDYYPYYLGSTLKGSLAKPAAGSPVVRIAAVKPNGERLAEERRLVAKIEAVETIYSYRRRPDGGMSWNTEYVENVCASNIELRTSATADTALALPLACAGDYILTVEDPETGVSFGSSFYLGSTEDGEIRAPLSNPTAVKVVPDKPFYRVGETPKLVVKSPFPGAALLTLLRDGVVDVREIELENATSEITLEPVKEEWAPNVDVQIAVVRSAAAGGNGSLAVRAHGESTIVVRPEDREIPVDVEAEVKGSHVAVSVAAPGADFVAVTLVDEGINLLTDEPVPSPIARFAESRTGNLDYYDLYSRLLPIEGDDVLKASGIKTGGGFGAELLSRVSPVPTRRFIPLAKWIASVPVADGVAKCDFDIGEFIGEVRVTAVAWSAKASGSAAVRRKAAPNLVARPDAPRFVAPGDEFTAILPLANTTRDLGEIEYSVAGHTGKLTLAAGDSTNLIFSVAAPAEPGEMTLDFVANGLGEKHESVIALPVRPAVPWRERGGVVRLAPGEAWDKPAGAERFAYSFGASRAAELAGAYRFLAEYPHGCLEQTTSRVFPLVGTTNVDVVAAGVRRVESMVRPGKFVMWPDCDYEPWDKEVPLYASHFLFVAERTGIALDEKAKRSVLNFLDSTIVSTNLDAAAYAALVKTTAGKADRGPMFRLYDRRAELSLLARSRLALAFATIGDKRRAKELLTAAAAPDSVREAAFALLALLAIEPGDARIHELATYLESNRDRECSSWGTTGENAHALLALGAYYRALPATAGKPNVVERDGKLVNDGDGTAFVSWKTLELPRADEIAERADGFALERRYLADDGSELDPGALVCGELVTVELKLRALETRDLNDLVIEDLLPGALEPVRDMLGEAFAKPSWVMRYDARDDRMLVFSKKFHLEKNDEVTFRYACRVVGKGAFALPAATCEAMYAPRLGAVCRGGRVVVRD